jgi:hypothetical protein
MTDQTLRGPDAQACADCALDRAAERRLGIASGGELPLAPKGAAQSVFHWGGAPDVQAHLESVDTQDGAAA